VSLDDIDDALSEWELWEQHWESQAMSWEPWWDQPELPDLTNWPIGRMMAVEGLDGYAATALHRRHLWGPIEFQRLPDEVIEPQVILLSPATWDELNTLWAQISRTMDQAFAGMIREFRELGRVFAGLLESEPDPEPTGDPLRDLAAQAIHDDADLIPPPVDPARITRGGQRWRPRRPRRPLDEGAAMWRGWMASERVATEVRRPRDNAIVITGI
jgi:hypothetical protein